MRTIRPVALIAAAVLLNGCRLIHGLPSDCHKPQEYQRAVQRAPLKVPEGLDSPNTQGALVIPTVDLVAPPPGPHEACLDTPPRYKAAPANKAGTPSS
ncbi:MAG: hypothetical protein ABSD02_01180 [Steroidobacteraceae bacterium]